MVDCQKTSSFLQFLKMVVKRQQHPTWRVTTVTMIVTMVPATMKAKIRAKTTATTVMTHQNLHLRRKSGVKKTTEPLGGPHIG